MCVCVHNEVWGRGRLPKEKMDDWFLNTLEVLDQKVKLCTDNE